ncbi:anaerobic C4-dicarboxylate transporter [Salmonella enterica subsp. enterica serovar Cerro str. FSL R8-0235]|nr:anaerobic C4-dicarboxylate transporter [Salmonella enterica subsp. enterica serovar Cerro str. FSL R8-0235]
MFWTELCFILVALMIGARIGGVFLGMVGGLGVGVMVFIFGLTPSTPPIDVILIILSVVLAAASLQASGGLDLLVKLAEKILRRHPRYITLLAPFICYIFTFMSGTGHVVYSLLPVISEVARDSGIRPERPLSISVIASQQAITASPISVFLYLFPLSHRNRRSGGHDWFNGAVGRLYFNHNDDLRARHVNRCSDGGNSDL